MKCPSAAVGSLAMDYWSLNIGGFGYENKLILLADF
jgi:hypothetical protein